MGINSIDSLSVSRSVADPTGRAPIQNEIKSTIATENVMQVRIHRLDIDGDFE